MPDSLSALRSSVDRVAGLVRPVAGRFRLDLSVAVWAVAAVALTLMVVVPLFWAPNGMFWTPSLTVQVMVRVGLSP